MGRRDAANISAVSCGFSCNRPTDPHGTLAGEHLNPRGSQRLNGGVRFERSLSKSQHDFFEDPVVKTRFPRGVGGSSLLAVSKPEKQKAENKAALCGKAGCSVSVCVSILTPSPPPPSLAKTRQRVNAIIS